MSNRLIELDDAGTSVWLDYIRRKLVTSGEMKRMVDEDGLRGMTSNPTIFEKAISGSTDYDEQVKELVGQGKTPLEIFQVIATDDIRAACDILRPVYDQLNRADGYVSMEVSPGAASDTEATLREARDLWKLIDRPNAFIKVPGTAEGLPAIEELIAEGINVNITLLFNVDNYVEVAERYIRGLERRHASGQPLDHVASVASFFVSRVDTAVDKQLQTKIDAGDGDAQKLKSLQGKAAIANAKIAYERFQEMFSGERWQKLAAAGAMVQRPLWASTSTKNPDYRDVIYIEELIGPDTVNTMPQATMTAFKDHGIVRQTLTADVPEAHRVLDELAAAGIDIDEVTRQLQVDGVRLFSESFDELLTCIEAEQTAIAVGLERSETRSLGTFAEAVEAELSRLQEENFVSRLWEKDGSLWSQDPQEQKSIADALGWLNIVHPMREHVSDLTEFAGEVRKEGLTDAVVLGMGGSSLCPDVLANSFAGQTQGLRLWILDTTDPAAVRRLTDDLDVTRTLFIVSSKSGTTAEPLAFFHYFWGKALEAGVANPGRHFVAITDPGTQLEEEARAKGFRHVFAGAPDIGGRYSALSAFGMVPAAVMGIDVDRLLSSAETMLHASQPCVAPSENPGVRLGAMLGVLAKAGHDKLTIVVDQEIGTFGGWVEQLIAESTGKSGTGILPVDREDLGPPEVYGDDRFFVYLRMRGSQNETTLQRMRALESAGHPVVVLEVGELTDLGGEFFLWEIATATAGHILQINAFDQPNVQESKDNTNRLLAEFEATGQLQKPDALIANRGITVSGKPVAGTPTDPTDYLGKFLDAHVKDGSYVAIMAYVEPSERHWNILQRLRGEIRDRFHVATTLGYGPRFLHSTGQLHKGGPADGVFIQIVSEEREDVAIEGQPFTFGRLIAAQSIGDFEALEKHELPVARFDLGSNVEGGLDLLARALSGVEAGS